MSQPIIILHNIALHDNRFQNRRYKTKRKQLQHELMIQTGSALQMIPANPPSSGSPIDSSGMNGSNSKKVNVKVLMKDDQLMYSSDEMNFLKSAIYPGAGSVSLAGLTSNYGYLYPPWIFGCSQ